MLKKFRRRLSLEQLEPRTLLTAYFVAPTGSDSNLGSSTQPWLTLQKAANSVQPGDMVTVRAGNYTGFNITKSGTAAAPITFSADPGAVINHPMAWGGLNFGINASGPSYNVIQGFTITAQPNDVLWDQGIRMGGIFPGGAIPNWATGNIIRNNTVQLRVVPVGDTTSNHDQLGIFASWQDGLQVLNNTESGGWDSGIYISNSSKNYTVHGNTVFNVGGNGIHNNGDAGQGGPGINTNAMIDDNIIHDVGFGIGGQAISCDGLQNSRIQNNLIYNTWSKGISLYVTNAAAGSINNIVVNNTVLTGASGHTGVAMRITGASTGNTILNNIFYNTVSPGWSYELDAGPDTIDYNVVMDPVEAGANLAAWRSWGWDQHGIVATPAQLFVNPAAGNYQLKAGSPAIGVGTATNAPNVDLLGNPRPSGTGYDIGAYEFQSGVASPPTTPTGLTATGGALQVALAWTAGANDVSYNVYRSTVSGFTPSSSNLIGNSTTASYTDASGVVGTTYFYVVTGLNSAGQASAASNQASASELAGLPGVPTNLSATAGPLQVSLGFTAGANDATYKIYRSTVSGFSISLNTLVATVSSTSYVDTNVTAGTTYFYLVTGVNSTGQASLPSVQVSATAQAGVPGVPTGLAATGGVLQIALSFTAGANDVSYKVYRSTVSGFTPSASTLIASPTTASYTDSSVTAGTTYYYLVTGVNSTGQASAASNQASASANAAAPGAPTGLTATGGVLQVALTWTAGSNDTSYKVYRSTVSGFTASASTLIASPTTASYTDTNVTGGTAYFYLVTGLNATGQESAPSSQASATPQAAQPPGVPTGLTAIGGPLQISLSWSSGSNDVSYKVYRSTVPGFTVASTNLVGSATGTTYTDATVTAGTTYYYLVTGLNTSGQESPPSNQASAAGQAGTPGAPTSLAATGGALKIVLTWTAGSNDASFKIYRSTVSGFAASASTLVGNSSTTGYTDNSVSAGSSYFYLVTGVNTTGQESVASNQASATAQAAAPGSPTGLTASGGSQKIALAWTAAANNASYKVYRSTVSTFTPSASTLVASPASAAYTDTSVVAGTTYFYVVTGLNTTGQESAPSNQASATAQGIPPSAPSTLTATGGVLKITLGWGAGSNDATYNIYRSTTSGFAISSSTLLASSSSTSYTDASGTVGPTYYYVVTGVDTTGMESSPSNQASAVELADLTPPTITITTPSSGATLTATITVTANATDNVTVAGVQFALDGTSLGSVASAPYSMTVDTTKYANGTHTLSATATDEAGLKTTASMQVSFNNPVIGLVAAYNFDQGTGSTLTDVSGNGNNGTINNATWSSTGKYGGALQFNGSTDSWVTVPSSASLGLTTGMTLEAWVDPVKLSNWRVIIDKERLAAKGLSYTLLATDTNSSASPPASFVNTGGSDQSAMGSARLATSTWTFVASTYDGSTLRMYVNGQLVGSASVMGSIVETADPLHIGGSAVWGEWFKGLIDNVRIYNVALTQSQLQTDMTTPVGSALSQMVLAASSSTALAAPAPTASTPVSSAPVVQANAGTVGSGGTTNSPTPSQFNDTQTGAAEVRWSSPSGLQAPHPLTQSNVQNYFAEIMGRLKTKHAKQEGSTLGGVDFWLD